MAACTIEGICQHLVVTAIITLAALCCTADQVCPLRPPIAGETPSGNLCPTDRTHARHEHSTRATLAYHLAVAWARGLSDWPFQAHIRAPLGQHSRQLNVDPTVGGLQTIASSAEASASAEAATDALATGGGAATGATAVGTAPGPQLPSKCPGQCTLYGTCNEELGR